MSVDELGRRAGTEVRRAASTEVPAELMLEALFATDRRRRLSSRLLATCVALLVLALGWRILAGQQVARTIPSGPIPSPVPTVTAPAVAQAVSPCDQLQECLGHRSYGLHFDLVEVTFTLPTGWTSTSHGHSDLDLYSPDLGYGVSVTEGISPPLRSTSGAPGGVLTAESVAHWLAGRPFLVSGPVTRTMFAGRVGWQVEVRLKAGEPAIAHCQHDGSQACVPLQLTGQTGFRSQGMWGEERMRWTFLDLPNAGPAAVSVWSFDNRPDYLTPAQPLIDTLRFSGA
jgi:hypothetical protein